MAELGTNCSECCFLVNSNCHLGLHNRFALAGAKISSQDGNIMLNRVCQYREKREVPFSELSDLAEEKRNSVYISGTIVIYKTTHDTVQLRDCLSKLNLIHNIDKFKVIICIANPDELNYVIDSSEIKKINPKYKFRFTKTFDLDLYGSLNEAARKSKNGYTFFIDADKSFPLDFIDRVNTFVNIDLRRFAIIHSNDLHLLTCPAIIFNYLQGFKGNSFYEKVLLACREQQLENMIFKWEDLDDNYTIE